jgi:PiT family inorganic phosphate transporter
MGTIAASWVISPVLGGVIAAAFLAFIKFKILYTENCVEAARKWVPILVGVMVSAFTMYLMMKGIKKIWAADTWQVIVIGIAAFFVTLLPTRKAVLHASHHCFAFRWSCPQPFCHSRMDQMMWRMPLDRWPPSFRVLIAARS